MHPNGELTLVSGEAGTNIKSFKYANLKKKKKKIRGLQNSVPFQVRLGFPAISQWRGRVLHRFPQRSRLSRKLSTSCSCRPPWLLLLLLEADRVLLVSVAVFKP